MTPRQADMCKKEVCKIFQKNDLSITIEVNLKVVNFLDITLDLNSGVFKPYMKPNNSPQYINRKSNHPPSIIKSIPEAVNKRLSSISQNEEVFNAAKAPFQESLTNSGFEHELKYQQPSSQNKKNKNRSRNRTWFNPPFSQNVSTNVGAKFLKLIDSCFPPQHPLAKIMNRNTVKVGYRCMPNMSQVINNHNTKILNTTAQETTPLAIVSKAPKLVQWMGIVRQGGSYMKPLWPQIQEKKKHILAWHLVDSKTGSMNTHRIWITKETREQALVTMFGSLRMKTHHTKSHGKSSLEHGVSTHPRSDATFVWRKSFA